LNFQKFPNQSSGPLPSLLLPLRHFCTSAPLFCHRRRAPSPLAVALPSSPPFISCLPLPMHHPSLAHRRSPSSLSCPARTTVAPNARRPPPHRHRGEPTSKPPDFYLLRAPTPQESPHPIFPDFLGNSWAPNPHPTAASPFQLWPRSALPWAATTRHPSPPSTPVGTSPFPTDARQPLSASQFRSELGYRRSAAATASASPWDLPFRPPLTPIDPAPSLLTPPGRFSTLPSSPKSTEARSPTLFPTAGRRSQSCHRYKFPRMNSKCLQVRKGSLVPSLPLSLAAGDRQRQITPVKLSRPPSY
jgi:hypothetical protein